MGKKINPKCFRLCDKNAKWDFSFYSDKRKDIVKFVKNSILLEKYISQERKKNYVSKVRYDMSSDGSEKVVLYSSRASFLVGKKGENVAKINAKLSSILTSKDNIRSEIKDIKREDIVSSLVAVNIANQIELRSSSYKKECRNFSDKVMSTGLVKGIKIYVKGRLNGADKASIFKIQKGSCPLHTIRADIDKGFEIANTKYGTLGITVIICHNRKDDIKLKRDTQYVKKHKI